MITAIDIFRSANVLIDKYGENASAEAQRWLETYKATDNIEGIGVWQQIIQAIEILQMPKGESKTIQ